MISLKLSAQYLNPSPWIFQNTIFKKISHKSHGIDRLSPTPVSQYQYKNSINSKKTIQYIIICRFFQIDAIAQELKFIILIECLDPNESYGILIYVNFFLNYINFKFSDSICCNNSWKILNFSCQDYFIFGFRSFISYLIFCRHSIQNLQDEKFIKVYNITFNDLTFLIFYVDYITIIIKYIKFIQVIVSEYIFDLYDIYLVYQHVQNIFDIPELYFFIVYRKDFTHNIYKIGWVSQTNLYVFFLMC